MKYLSDYMQEAQSEAFAELGVFFAFSDKQFDEQKVEGVRYASVGSGMIVPRDNVEVLVERLKSIATAAIAQDISENGIDAIIDRELGNYECYYTGDYSDAVDALVRYGITADQVRNRFYANSNDQG